MKLNKFEIDNLIKDNVLLKETVKELKLDKEALTKQLSIQGVSNSFNSEEELLQFIYLHIPLAIKPISKIAKSSLVTPFTSMHALKEVCKQLAEKLFNDC